MIKKLVVGIVQLQTPEFWSQKLATLLISIQTTDHVVHGL